MREVVEQPRRAVFGKLGAWLQAARLPSQANIAPALLLGQVLAWRVNGALDVSALVVVFGFGLLLQLTIVFANDYADVVTDSRNLTATPFSGGSRVLVQGLLQPRQLRGGAGVTATGTLALSAWLGPIPLVLAVVALSLLWLYSFRPVRLSYRGGGELLQMLGVGVVLPAYGWVAQGEALAEFPWLLLTVLLPLHWAGAVATALPDEPSDRDSDKHTAVVWLGSRAAGVAMFASHCAAFLAVFTLLGCATAVPLLAVPVVAACVQLALMSATPGSRSMLVRVTSGMLATVAMVLGLSVWAWPG